MREEARGRGKGSERKRQIVTTEERGRDAGTNRAGKMCSFITGEENAQLY